MHPISVQVEHWSANSVHTSHSPSPFEKYPVSHLQEVPLAMKCPVVLQVKQIGVPVQDKHPAKVETHVWQTFDEFKNSLSAQPQPVPTVANPLTQVSQTVPDEHVSQPVGQAIQLPEL